MEFSLLAPDPARIDPAWMTEALTRAGVLRDARIADMTRKAVGNGLLGDSYRFTLAYDRDAPGAPASVVGKFPALDPASRRSGSDLLLYLREICFYLSTYYCTTP